MYNFSRNYSIIHKSKYLYKIQCQSTSSYVDIGTSKYWLLQFDGGSRGNPGISGSGSVIYEVQGDKSKEIWNQSVYLGSNCTNNVAEYIGLIQGLKYIIKVNNIPKNIKIQGDSSLVLNQVQGIYKVNNGNLKILFAMVSKLISKFDHSINLEFQHIPRQFNSRADFLSNKAMNNLKDDNVLHIEAFDFLNDDLKSLSDDFRIDNPIIYDNIVSKSPENFENINLILNILSTKDSLKINKKTMVILSQRNNTLDFIKDDVSQNPNDFQNFVFEEINIEPSTFTRKSVPISKNFNFTIISTHLNSDQLNEVNGQQNDHFIILEIGKISSYAKKFNFSISSDLAFWLFGINSTY